MTLCMFIIFQQTISQLMPHVMIKDKLQEIMIKSQGLKLPELSEKTKNQIIQFEKQNYKLIMSDIIGKHI